MQTSDLNINNTESDHANAIFRQFQDAIFSREHTPVKTLTKIIFDLLQWQKIATLSLRKKSCHPFFHLNNTSREGGGGGRLKFFSVHGFIFSARLSARIFLQTSFSCMKFVLWYCHTPLSPAIPNGPTRNRDL